MSKGGLRNEAERLLVDAATSARSLAPDLEVTTRLVDGAATAALLDQCLAPSCSWWGVAE